MGNRSGKMLRRWLVHRGEYRVASACLSVTDVNTVVTSDNSADDIIEKVKEQKAILQREIEGTRNLP